MKVNDWPIGHVVTRSSLKREVKSRASQIRQCCQRLATAATFFQKEQFCLGAMTRSRAVATGGTGEAEPPCKTLSPPVIL